MTAQELDLKAELSVGVQEKIGEAEKLVVHLNLQLFVGCLELRNGAAASLPWKLLRTYFESCANIVQAVVYCPPYRPLFCCVARRCSLKKSVQIHVSS